MLPRIKAAIIGGSGYTGGELIRLLLMHNRAEVTLVTSRKFENKPIYYVHRNLQKFTDLRFASEPIDDIVDKVDIIFFCLPHGESMNEVPKAIGKAKVIDMSGDFRLKDYKEYEKYYKIDHAHKRLLKMSVYGLSEFNRELIQKNDFVANPGCFPTGSLLGLLPLAKAGLIEDKVVINAITGSSGSGYIPKQVTHHPERSLNFKAYGIFDHRHQPEIIQEISQFSNDFDLIFTPHSAPLSRGIFTSSYVFLNDEVSEKEVQNIFYDYYKNDFFIRIVDDVNLSVVKNTNFCNIGFKVNQRKIAIFSAIDNLVKGASGQAIQNMNIMFGFDEKIGLKFPGSIP